MRVLVANLGSTSFKYRLYAIDGIDGAEARMLARGGFERVTDYGAVIDQAMDELASAGHKSQPKGRCLLILLAVKGLWLIIPNMLRWSNRTTTHTYDAVGRLRKTERPNGTKRNQVYDAAGQLRFIEERSATDVLLWMRALEYDADGRITKTHTWPSNTASSYTAPNASDSTTYDNDNRIAQWSLGSGGSVNAVFDDDGNMTHGPAVNNPNSTGLGYQYDAYNRLTGVGGQANLYRYNPEGYRVEASGVAYVIDPNAALSRTLMRVDGSTTTYYIWGANGLEYEITGASTKTYHADHLGSTMLLTNDNGQPTGDYYEYDSYGTQTYRTGTASTPFQWHGTLGVTTENNGLVHMRARFYHPRIMRFVNEDPIGFQGGMNLFAFVNGDPISGVDPAGLCRYDWNSNTIAPTSLIQTNTLNRAVDNPASGGLVGFGNEIQLTGVLREEYVARAAQLSPTDSAGRELLKAEFRARQTALGKAITNDILKTRAQTGNMSPLSNASRTNASVNMAGTAMKYGGRTLITVGIGMEVYNVATAPEGQRNETAARAGGRLSGGLIGGWMGAQMGTGGGPWGVAAGALVGGIGGAIAGDEIVKIMQTPQTEYDKFMQTNMNVLW
jgi:RHS repeat-associated protein